MDIPQGLRIALRYARAFREAEIPYMIVGAWAVMVHGWPRSSSDIDLVVQLPFAERAPVEDVLRKLGHHQFEERRDEWGHRLAVELENEMELEVFFTPPRPPYSEEYARRVVVDVEGEAVPFLSAEDLVLRKIMNTRLRRGHDFDDAVGVLHVQKGKIDIARLLERAAFYRVNGKLQQAIEAAEKVDSA